jgi:transcriptional regulator GlxA family with amidase domain
MHFPRPLVSGGLAPWQLRLARDTINSRLEEELSLEQLAHECRLSVTHFAKAFARSTGISPHRWLMQRRVDVAKDLMLTTDSSLVEISLRCGFSDQKPFYKDLRRSHRKNARTVASDSIELIRYVSDFLGRCKPVDKHDVRATSLARFSINY